MINIIDKHKCNGCKGCAEVCPVGAIEYEVDREGFWYPLVDKKKCIDCGLCNKFCPIESVTKYQAIQNVYAGYSRDTEIRKNSTSGGIYEILARYVLSNGGYLVASQYSDDFKSAFHTVGNTEQDLSKFIGSKYFQSDTKKIYIKTKDLLEQDNLVLFVGTPCQVVALKKYLNKDYEKLITCDFICRGVPSPKMQARKIDYYEKKYHSKVVSYRDKSKFKSWSFFGELIKLENGKTKFISRYLDWFNNCFILYNFNIRPSCYECKYKGDNHASDITIGDFWGVQGVTDKDLRDGVSAIITNTEQGEKILSEIRDRLYLSRRTVEDVSKGNPAHVCAINEPQNRDKFFDDIEKMPLRKAINKNCGVNPIKFYLQGKKILFIGWVKNYKDLIHNFKNIMWIKFLKYNYFCPNVKRDKYCFLIPFKNTNIHIDKTARVELHGSVLLNYYPCYKDNKMMNLFVRKNATFIANNRAEISFGNTITVNDNATLKMGYIFTGVSTGIICNHDIEIGNYVMLGRDVLLFDSDYHDIYDSEFKKTNLDMKLTIEDNVWIGARAMILKGACLKYGTIVAAGSTVIGETEPERVYVVPKAGKSVGKQITWRK